MAKETIFRISDKQPIYAFFLTQKKKQKKQVQLVGPAPWLSQPGLASSVHPAQVAKVGIGESKAPNPKTTLFNQPFVEIRRFLRGKSCSRYAARDRHHHVHFEKTILHQKHVICEVFGPIEPFPRTMGRICDF